MTDNYKRLQYNLHILKDIEGCEIVEINELGIYFEFVYLQDKITKHIVLKALGVHDKFSETQYSKFNISTKPLKKVKSFDGTTEEKVKSTPFVNLAKINKISFNSKSSSYTNNDSLVLHGESNNGKPLNYFIDIMFYDNPIVSLHSHKFLSELDVQDTIDTYEYVAFAQSSDILSQWYKCEFRDSYGEVYNSCEQYMMAAKALLFDDTSCYKKIMASEDVKNIKQFGKEVAHFNQEIWDDNKEQIVYDANFLKFSQNQELKEFLLKSKKKMIVEVNPNDIVWACGCFEKDAKTQSLWRGENLLGQILMKVRGDIQ